MSVLVVEDDYLIAINLCTSLRSHGFSVYDPVYRGEKAIEISQKNKPDLVILDINLKGQINGIEAASEIKKSNPDVKFVFITGYYTLEYKKKAKLLKPLAFLDKPVDFSEILKIIK